ncbi:histidine ammonia-lyase [Desulfosarcina sp. BuS5]|uniref:histidine ammonia-lyase n=1 Tax=Desulfosarcina sp. BuS5 TaxID=933262 RepID=UPI00047F1BD1|nr:histidine ammonia-lyase [Desulfosarcina sp. BuS5]WDN89199.1 histidine ammonia-lyase [Desulfosarcina sp. BuS5]
MKKKFIGLEGMSLQELASIARDQVKVKLTEGSKKRILASRNLVEQWLKEEKAVYGITTGFGALSDVRISRLDTRKLQKNILMSHACGVGNPFDEEIVRAVLALRIKDLARGNSGIRLETVNFLVEILNRGVCPLIPEKGSVGASGDLAPLAHLGLVLIGLGEARYKNCSMSGKEALRLCGLSPLSLEAGEGLALLNGTQVMTGIGGLTVYDSLRLAKIIDIAAAMSLEVLLGSRTEFDARIHKLRPHPGQITAAGNMDRIIHDSEIISSHKDCGRIQDAYTLRCSPQVHGASRDAIEYAMKTIETEINSSTNNPLIFPESGDFLLGGNFHGQPVALAMDFLGIAVSELANISERRIERLVNPKLSGLPAFLVNDGGLNSGFMIAQYTAAALVSENKVLSHPASVDSIPTSANKEDHVSMGTIAARKCREIVKNAEHVVAIELLCGAQAMDLFTNIKPGKGTMAAYRAIRSTVKHLDNDRILYKDIEALKQLIQNEKILEAVEAEVGAIA